MQCPATDGRGWVGIFQNACLMRMTGVPSTLDQQLTKFRPLTRVASSIVAEGNGRMHGGRLGGGAPSGRDNGNYRHGRYTREAIAERRRVRTWLP